MAAIGKVLAGTKSSVAGQRNRMGLPERGSPIRPRAVARAELTPGQAARRAANMGEALPAGHPIAVAVLAEAGITFQPGTWPHG